MADWRDNLLEDDDRIAELLAETSRVAVLGIKTEAQSAQPAYYVPKFMRDQPGVEVIPVPVYYPDATEILGAPVYRSVAAIPEPVDLVDVFRRARDIPAHVDDLLKARPKAVWFQSGIRNDTAAQRLAEAGILVVQDRCLMIEWRRMGP